MQLSRSLLLAPMAAAFPHYSEYPHGQQHIKPYVAPGPHDSRSPCPGLNTLANHGYLPHNGRDITEADIVKAFGEVFNMDPIMVAAVNKPNFDAINNPPVVALSDFNAPAASDHRASTTRYDPGKGYSPKPQPELVDGVLRDTKRSKFVDATTLATSRLRVEADSITAHGPLPDGTATGGSGTAALLLVSLPSISDWKIDGNSTNLKAPKPWVNVYLREERLPVELGWTTPKHHLLAEELGGVTGLIEASKKVQTAAAGGA